MLRVTIDKGDPIRLLPQEAWDKIHTVLFNEDEAAPGREEQIELYAKMMYHSLHMAEAKIILLDKKASMCMKMFLNWRPLIAKLKKVTTP